MEIYDDSVAFWFYDFLMSLLSGLSLHTNTKDAKFIHEVWSLQTLAKHAYLDKLYSLFSDSRLGEDFEEKVEQIYNREKKYISFLGNFLKEYIEEKESIVDSDGISSDGSIVLDFYPRNTIDSFEISIG